MAPVERERGVVGELRSLERDRRRRAGADRGRLHHAGARAVVGADPRRHRVGLDEDAGPTAALEQVGVAVAEAVVRPDLDVDARVPPGEVLDEDQILAVLGSRVRIAGRSLASAPDLLRDVVGVQQRDRVPLARRQVRRPGERRIDGGARGGGRGGRRIPGKREHVDELPEGRLRLVDEPPVVLDEDAELRPPRFVEPVLDPARVVVDRRFADPELAGHRGPALALVAPGRYRDRGAGLHERHPGFRSLEPHRALGDVMGLHDPESLDARQRVEIVGLEVAQATPEPELLEIDAEQVVLQGRAAPVAAGGDHPLRCRFRAHRARTSA